MKTLLVVLFTGLLVAACTTEPDSRNRLDGQWTGSSTTALQQFTIKTNQGGILVNGYGTWNELSVTVNGWSRDDGGTHLEFVRSDGATAVFDGNWVNADLLQGAMDKTYSINFIRIAQ